MPNANWPLVITQIAFNAAPNNAASVPTWVDVSPRLRQFEAGRGRQYEIDQNQAGEATAVFSDKDEALNPANSASPYAPNILPYRAIVQQAMWPPAAVGAAVNLLNAQSGYDPSHENTAVGALPPNIVFFQANPSVSTSTPRTGSRALTWPLTSGAGARYIGLDIPCIPGWQYTASVYVRQTSGTFTSFINGAAAGTNTTTTGAYVRLSVTFTATKPVHQFYVGHAAQSSSGTAFADDWQLNEVLRSTVDNKPVTNAVAAARGSRRANRPAIRATASSSTACHRSGSTLWHAATARSSVVFTNHR